MKKIVCALVMIAALSAGGLSLAAEDSLPGSDAVIVEMLLLDEAFKNAIDGLILNVPEIIEEPFHKVHRAKMNTEKALKEGAVKLPKNSDKLAEFIELDELFHEKLVGLLNASREKDMNAVKGSIHEIMNGCVQCHDRFRN